MEALFLVKGTRSWASVEKVKRATSSSGLSAARAVLAASRKGPRNGPIESLRSKTRATSSGSSSRLKMSMFWATPSSRSSKCSFFSSDMTWPGLGLHGLVNQNKIHAHADHALRRFLRTSRDWAETNHAGRDG